MGRQLGRLAVRSIVSLAVVVIGLAALAVATFAGGLVGLVALVVAGAIGGSLLTEHGHREGGHHGV